MNIEQAKAVPLVLILEKLGVSEQRTRSHEAWYLSPLRQEKTASFKVHTGKNIWYDFGEGKGGDTVAFASAYLQSIDEEYTIPDSLRWIENMAGLTPVIRPVQIEKDYDEDKKLVLREVATIEHRLLIDYLKKRGIPLELAFKYLKQARIYNKETRKSFFALGFANEEKGYEIRNPFFKGCLGSKAITFIRGSNPKPDGIHFFEGFMDFLSALADKDAKKFDDDTIILNSLSNLQAATPYIKNYGYRIAYSWMDNDKAGWKASKALNEFIKTEADMKHKLMNKVYEDSKDVNAGRMKKLGLGE